MKNAYLCVLSGEGTLPYSSQRKSQICGICFSALLTHTPQNSTAHDVCRVMRMELVLSGSGDFRTDFQGNHSLGI